MDQRQEVNKCLDHLGNYWRNDWSGFDGRTLQHQLSQISDVMAGVMTADQFCEKYQID